VSPTDAVPPAEQSPTLLVVQPDPLDWLDRFTPWIAEEGLTTRATQLSGHAQVPEVLLEDGLIVLGGEMSSLDDDHHPWLEGIRCLIRNAVAQRKPVLGICLGGQLVAQALGGKVSKGASGVEDGVITIHRRTASADDPLFARMPTDFPVACWHEDAIADLPEGAVWLAHSDRYRNQAFRIGDRTWGLQFHPEVSPQTYRRWAARAEEQLPGSRARTTPGMEQVRSRAGELTPHAEALARAFASQVRQSATHNSDSPH
jgi:GMP synthase (glutamine-hydrolysing)